MENLEDLSTIKRAALEIGIVTCNENGQYCDVITNHVMNSRLEKLERLKFTNQEAHEFIEKYWEFISTEPWVSFCEAVNKKYRINKETELIEREKHIDRINLDLLAVMEGYLEYITLEEALLALERLKTNLREKKTYYSNKKNTGKQSDCRSNASKLPWVK